MEQHMQFQGSSPFDMLVMRIRQQLKQPKIRLAVMGMGAIIILAIVIGIFMPTRYYYEDSNGEPENGIRVERDPVSGEDLYTLHDDAPRIVDAPMFLGFAPLLAAGIPNDWYIEFQQAIEEYANEELNIEHLERVSMAPNSITHPATNVFSFNITLNIDQVDLLASVNATGSANRNGISFALAPSGRTLFNYLPYTDGGGESYSIRFMVSRGIEGGRLVVTIRTNTCDASAASLYNRNADEWIRSMGFNLADYTIRRLTLCD